MTTNDFDKKNWETLESTTSDVEEKSIVFTADFQSIDIHPTNMVIDPSNYCEIDQKVIPLPP